MATKKATELQPYTVIRTGEETWVVDGVEARSLDHAQKLCCTLDEARGFEWDMSTYGECVDGLSALRIGERITVTYPEEDE